MVFALGMCVSHVHAQTTHVWKQNPLVDNLVGHWRMDGIVRGTTHVAYDLVATRVMDGRYVQLHMKDVARPARYEATVFVGEDTLPDRIIVHWLDSFGAAYSVPPGVGSTSGDTLMFDVPYPDGAFHDTFTFHRDTRSWTFRLDASDGKGGWKVFATYDVKRVTAPLKK